MENSEITSANLSKLPIGSKTTFKCRNGKHCESVRVMSYRVPKIFPERMGCKYFCSINYVKSEVTVEVKRLEQPKSGKK